MLLKKVCRFFCSTVSFEAVNGKYEKLLNKIAKNQTAIWNISSIVGGFSATCLYKDYKKIAELGKGFNCDVSLAKEKGIITIIKRYKLRFGIPIGGLLLIAFIILTQFFIWDIRVVGNDYVSQEEILSALEKTGISGFKFIPSIDFKEKKHEALAKLPMLSWMGFTRSGCVITVEVTEGVNKAPPRLEEPCDIIAETDGVVRFVQVESGVAKVNINDTVQKGDVLISGTVLGKNGYTRKTHARGKIIVEALHTKEISIEKSAYERNYTGKKKTRIFFNFFTLRIPLFIALPIDGEYELSYNKNNMDILGNEIAIGFESYHYKFYEKSGRELSQEEYIKGLEAAFKQYEATELMNCGIVQRNTSVYEQNGVYTMKTEYYLEKEIGIENAIDPTIPAEPIPESERDWEHFAQ